MWKMSPSNQQSPKKRKKRKKNKIRVQVRYVKSDEVKGLTDKEVVPSKRCDDKYTCSSFLSTLDPRRI
jgi:hypothetical protein